MELALLHGVCAGLIGFAFAHVMAGKPGPWSIYFDALAAIGRIRWKRYPWIGWHWLAYPLGGCESCFSGQLALWTAWYSCGFELRYSVACSVLTSARCDIVLAYVLHVTVLWLRK